jgi:hypothetical protein
MPKLARTRLCRTTGPARVRGSRLRDIARPALCQTARLHRRHPGAGHEGAGATGNELPALAADLVRRKVTVVAVLGSTAAQVAKAATQTPLPDSAARQSRTGLLYDRSGKNLTTSEAKMHQLPRICLLGVVSFLTFVAEGAATEIEANFTKAISTPSPPIRASFARASRRLCTTGSTISGCPPRFFCTEPGGPFPPSCHCLQCTSRELRRRS